jgi:MoaA/NifB/PqqE/SkfB family radical SAM enzyme
MAKIQTGNFLDMSSKMLSARNRPLLEAFVRGAPVADFHPVTVTLDATLDCNARCAGCVEESPMQIAGRRYLAWSRLKRLIPELQALGVRAIELYGGEPLYYPSFADLVRLIAALKLQFAIVTNGALLENYVDVLTEVRSNLAWLRVSINAGTAATHQAMFRFADGNRFEAILRSAATLVERGVNLGFSYVVTPRNAAEIAGFAQRCAEIGVAYLELKPMIHPETKHLLPLPAPLRQEISRQVASAAGLHHSGFRIVLTESLRLVLAAETAEELRQPKDYPFCPASLFRGVISPLAQPGVVVSCPYHRASPHHITGTLAYRLDQDWLKSARRAEVLQSADPRVECGFWCNRHAMNQALWDLRWRYEAGERDVLDRVPVVDHPDDCWL